MPAAFHKKHETDRERAGSGLREKKRFYRRALGIALPIMIQNAITSLVGMLDNVMVGRIGTDQMSGVAIINQLYFIWYLCIFGGLSGIGIFTAQFYGKGDHEGVRYTFRLQLCLAAILTGGGFLIMRIMSDPLIRMFLHEDEGIGSVEATFAYAGAYLSVLLLEMIPFALTQVYASVLKSAGETRAPMRASLIAVVVNLVGNYLLIYGKFGAPQLGVVGAAAATVIARFVECASLIIYAHRRSRRYPFLAGAYRSLYVPLGLVKSCSIKGLPLLVNEALWSGAQAFLMRNYSLRGLSVVAAYNILQTVSQVFNVAFLAMGVASGIILGQELGRGESRGTLLQDAGRLTWFSVGLCILSGGIMFALSSVFPLLYQTSDEIRGLAAGLLRAAALCMPLFSYTNSAYFILRSGGKTLVTFLFDSCFCWVLSVPLSYYLAMYTGLPILAVYVSVQMLELVKCVIGGILVKKGVWINDITAYSKA